MTDADILYFWFVEAGAKKWYKGGEAFDALVREKFESITQSAYVEIQQTGTHAWRETANGTLALILMFDQFSRNMFRGTKKAFAFDDIGLSLAQKAIERGHDLESSQEYRGFFYTPFMHSEDIEMQNMCVQLVEERKKEGTTLFHAKAHRDIILRFGRFPYRNDVLERASTSDEINYLANGGYLP